MYKVYHKYVQYTTRRRMRKMDTYKKYIDFPGKILQIGFGSVGRCIMPLLLRHLKVKPNNITVFDTQDNTQFFQQQFPNCNYEYDSQGITKDNYCSKLKRFVGSGDMIIDVSVDIDAADIINWCQEHRVLYINTSLENWPGEYQTDGSSPMERTLYAQHARVRQAVVSNHRTSTAVVTHGANPGLVSHFTKAALLDIAEHVGVDTEHVQFRYDWANLAHTLSVDTIHISERDTQVSIQPKLQNEFVNTWSVEGFWAEGIAPAEMGWGTHEKEIPINGHRPGGWPNNTIYLDQPGCDTLIKSWVPLGGEIHGFCIQHSEAITISEFLTVYASPDDDPVYSPTVHYAYHPCDAAIVSLHEMRMNELQHPDNQRIMYDDITSGIDELGVLLMGHNATSWWYGSQLSIEDTRNLLGMGQNPTTLQVAASLLGAIIWMIKNPECGYCEPEYLPHDEVLEVANQYLGPVVSMQTDWKPINNRNDLFPQDLDYDNWTQFKNYLVK